MGAPLDSAFSMSNEELKVAIADAFWMTRNIGSYHESYAQTHKHYQVLLDIQQRRAALMRIEDKS